MKMLLLLALVAVALAGCARRYKMTLNNGNTITTSSKPKLNPAGTAYVYKDHQGRETWVSSGKVREIEPQ